MLIGFGPVGLKTERGSGAGAEDEEKKGRDGQAENAARLHRRVPLWDGDGPRRGERIRVRS